MNENRPTSIDSTICSACGKGFSSCNEKVRHERLCKSQSSAKGEFCCVKCNMTFSTRLLLHHHLKSVHSEAKDVVCDVCGMAFKLRIYMLKHKNTVHGEKTISCDLCDMKFSERGTYRDDKYYCGLLFGSIPFPATKKKEALFCRRYIFATCRS